MYNEMTDTSTQNNKTSGTNETCVKLVDY